MTTESITPAALRAWADMVRRVSPLKGGTTANTLDRAADKIEQLQAEIERLTRGPKLEFIGPNDPRWKGSKEGPPCGAYRSHER